MKKIKLLLSFIKFEHTIFAFPFAVISAFVAARESPTGLPTWHQIGFISLAMVGARSAAMGFNRIADINFDRLNPRTKSRELPTGKLTLAEAWLFVIISSALFLFSAKHLNQLTFLLSPIALAAILLYSFSKRFTVLSHWVLGYCLSIAPAGAWIAIRDKLELPPLLLTGAVTLWVAGFDIIYSCQDVEFDRKMNLQALPAKVGIASALLIARLGHVGMLGFLILLGLNVGLGWAYFLGVAVVAAFLLYEHSLVKPNDLSRVNLAFFTLNGLVSIFLMVFALVDILGR